MKKVNWIGLGAILILSSAIYASLWAATPLTWDDGSNIFNNPYFTMNMWWGVWSEAYFGLYVPVISSLWALLFYLGQGEALPFRIFNIVLHAANICLLFLLLQDLARRWNLSSPIAVSLAVAVFALHPLQVEAVAWISGGRDLLSTFFALSALALYLRFRTHLGYLGATTVFILALLSKPNVVILPFVIVLIEVFLGGKKWQSSMVTMLPWIGLSLMAIFVTQLAQVDYFAEKINWWQRPLIVVDTDRFYVQKIFWPHPLSGNYARTPEKVVADLGSLVKGFLALCILAAAGVWAWRRDRRYFIGGLWFVLLLPVSGLVPFGYQTISSVADHYNYLPMTAVAAVFLLLWDYLWRWRILVAVPLMLIGAWSWASYQRTHVWQSDVTFFTDMAQTAPDSYNTALGMSVVMCEDLKDFDTGLRWVDKALAAKPDDILALANRAYCLLNAGRIKAVIDMEFYLQHLDSEQLATYQPTAYSSLLASVGTAMVQDQIYEQGFKYLCEAYRVLPSEPNHAHNLEAAAAILRQQGLKPSCAEEEPE